MHFLFCSIEIDCYLATLFRQRTFHFVFVGLFLRAVGRESIFLFGRFIACINTYLYGNLEMICQGKLCKIDKPSSLSIKTLKNMTPRKDGNGIFF